jgi:hypothetical protein
MLRFKIQKSTEELDALDADHQRKYRSGVGMLQYLTKYLCSDICNMVRGISKYMESETWGTYNELLRIIKFVIDTKLFGQKVQPKLYKNLD